VPVRPSHGQVLTATRLLAGELFSTSADASRDGVVSGFWVLC
jgi:hypothetical protein